LPGIRKMVAVLPYHAGHVMKMVGLGRQKGMRFFRFPLQVSTVGLCRPRRNKKRAS
jgi:hypothetical protein